MNWNKVAKISNCFQRKLSADKPEGWDESSFDSWWESVTGDDNEAWDQHDDDDYEDCVKKMKDEEDIDNPYAFCHWMENKAE